eukprot:15468915-Alexandrium_andersonii.AAC.1
MLGFQPGAAEAKVLRRLPCCWCLARGSLGGPPGLGALLLPGGEPVGSLRGAQPTVLAPVAGQPRSRGAVGDRSTAAVAGAAEVGGDGS